MRSKTTIKSIQAKNTLYYEKAFSTSKEMAEHALKWTIFCPYQFYPNTVNGLYQIISLASIQIAYTKAFGGVMYDYVAPKDCITLSIIKAISHKGCLDHIKLTRDMITIVDDEAVHNFMYNGEIEIYDISIQKSAYPLLTKSLKYNIEKYYIDKNQRISFLLESILEEHNAKEKIVREKELEERIIHTLFTVIKRQEAQIPHLTESEWIIYDIKKQIFKHADGNISIQLMLR